MRQTQILDFTGARDRERSTDECNEGPLPVFSWLVIANALIDK
jgi:hypothetical protein